MKGWMYRRAVDLKNLGERISPRCIGCFIRNIGLAIRDWVLGHSTADEFMVTPRRGRR
jgi:hypothetical protein